MSAAITSLQGLLFTVSKVEEYDSKELAQLSQMSTVQIKLTLATQGSGRDMCRENAILLKSLIANSLDAQKTNATDAKDPSYGTPNLSKEFTCFPSLPLELQRLIWKHALPGSQVIVFYRYRRIRGVIDVSFDWLDVEGSSQRPLLRLMRTCHEAYEVVRSHYCPINIRAFGVTRLPPGALLLLDPNIDIVSLEDTNAARSFLRDVHASTQLGAQALAKIQSLTLNYDAFHYITNNNSFLGLVDLIPFKSLEKIFVIRAEENEVWPKEASFFESRKWPMRLSAFESCGCAACGDNENEIAQRWDAALKNRSVPTSLASIQIKSATLTRDRNDQPPTVCDIIAQEMDKLEANMRMLLFEELPYAAVPFSASTSGVVLDQTPNSSEIMVMANDLLP